MHAPAAPLLVAAEGSVEGHGPPVRPGARRGLQRLPAVEAAVVWWRAGGWTGCACRAGDGMRLGARRHALPRSRAGGSERQCILQCMPCSLVTCTCD